MGKKEGQGELNSIPTVMMKPILHERGWFSNLRRDEGKIMYYE